MDIKRLAKQLIRDEDCKLMPYRCSAGKLTIGIGRNLEDRGISQDEADLMFSNDIRAVEDELSQLPTYLALGDVRQTVIANMAFNLGLPTLKEFKRMWAALGRADYPAAADEMLDSKWARQVGGRAHRLARMMREGEFDD